MSAIVSCRYGSATNIKVASSNQWSLEIEASEILLLYIFFTKLHLKADLMIRSSLCYANRQHHTNFSGQYLYYLYVQHQPLYELFGYARSFVKISRALLSSRYVLIKINNPYFAIAFLYLFFHRPHF